MKISKDKIEVNTINAFIALAVSLVLFGLWLGAIKTDIASANQTNAEQDKDIGDLETKIGTLVTKESFDDFKKTNKEMVDLIRAAYPKY